MKPLRSGRRLRLVAPLVSALLIIGTAGQAAASPARSDHSGPTRSDIGPVATAPTTSNHSAIDRTVDRLGPSRTGGAYLDGHGRAVITVTTRRAAEQARSAGTTTRAVTYSLSRLRQVQRALDGYAAAHGAGAVQEWHIDVVRNRVDITAPSAPANSATRHFLDFATSFGAIVSIKSVESTIRPASGVLLSSDSITFNNRLACSVGFNAVNDRGQAIILTAGHCLESATAAYRGSLIGTTSSVDYPVTDFGAVQTDTANWIPEPAVNKYDGTARAVLGISQPPVGTQVCKASSTTGWTCGTIQAYDQTVNYGNGNIVYGLVRFSACVEPGDSGGAVMDGSSAVGLISGAQFFTVGGGTELCGGAVGEPNVSFYQPIGPVLDALGARLLIYAPDQR